MDGLQMMKQADDLRDKSVIGFKKEDVQRFELTAEGQTIRVERWCRCLEDYGPSRREGEEKVNSILMSFERLKGTKIVADNPRT